MKLQFKFKLLLLVAILATVFLTCFDASASSSVIHFANNISVEHVGLGMASFAIVPLATFVKDNCGISVTEIAALTAKHGKIKILTVMIEPPTYDEAGNLTDKGEFYSYAVKRPDSGTVRLLMNFAKQGKTDDYLQSFIKNLVVAGDTETLNKDGIVYLGFASKVDEFLKPYESFLGHA